MSSYICTEPFRRIAINLNGSVSTCCPNYLKSDFYIGNIYNVAFDRIWNSDNAKKLRYSVVNGEYGYCNKTYCNVLQKPEKYLNIMLPKETAHISIHNNWQDYYLEEFPTFIDLSVDDTCNLYCSTCRRQVRINSNITNIKISKMLENSIRPLLKNCLLLTTNGNGEFFVSKALTDFYRTLSKKEFPLLKLYIITNGTVLTPKRLEMLLMLKGMINTIHVSIDASEKEIYEKLRRGSKWNVLERNMEFLSSLRIVNEIENLTVSFVVQKENFHQMKDFVSLAKSWKVDNVTFRRLKNIHGIFSETDFLEKDVFLETNPNYVTAVKILQELRQYSDININDNCLAY